MLCVRCGMDSSTTDVCEWCKRPFLPPGAKVTAHKPGKPGQAPAAREAGGVEEPPPPAVAPLPPDLVAAEPSQPTPQAQAPAPAESADDVLRPLGAQAAGQAVRPLGGGPSHGLSDDATATSMDMSQYQGADQSVLQPLERPQTPGASTLRDPLAARRKAARERYETPEIPDNVRLLRATVSGAVLAGILSIVRFLTSNPHQVPDKLVQLIPIPSNDQLTGALVYGLLSAVLLGFMLAALLVQFRRGPFAGLLIGLVLGLGALGGWPWGVITGAVCGLATGYYAGKGLHRVINV